MTQAPLTAADAVALLQEAIARIEHPRGNFHGGTMRVGGAYWRIARVLKDFLEPRLAAEEGEEHARFLMETHGRIERCEPACARVPTIHAERPELVRDIRVENGSLPVYAYNGRHYIFVRDLATLLGIEADGLTSRLDKPRNRAWGVCRLPFPKRAGYVGAGRGGEGIFLPLESAVPVIESISLKSIAAKSGEYKAARVQRNQSDLLLHLRAAHQGDAAR